MAMAEQQATRAQRAWNFAQKCQIKGSGSSETLWQLLDRHGFFSDENQPARQARRQPPAKRPAKDPKWKSEHQDYMKSRPNLDLNQEHLLRLKELAMEVGLTEREQDMLLLKAADKVNLQGLLAIAIGDSIGWARLTRFHPCVLPSKKYCYLLNGSQLFVNSVYHGIPLALQGLGPRELRMAGIDGPESLTAKDAWDLAGNAFTSTVLAAILFGVVVADH